MNGTLWPIVFLIMIARVARCDIREFTPPVLREVPSVVGVSGIVDVSLNVVVGRVNGPPGVSILARTYDGSAPGPTIRVRPGEVLRVTVNNKLEDISEHTFSSALSCKNYSDDEPLPNKQQALLDCNTFRDVNYTNLHVHGLFVSPLKNGDNMKVKIPPQASFQYEYHIPSDHPSGTYFYHPHYHGSTSLQFMGGMAGALIVEDVDDAFAGVKEHVILLQTLSFSSKVRWYYHHTILAEFAGDNLVQHLPQAELGVYPLVNGQYRPSLDLLVNEWVRLRLINAAGSQAFDIPEPANCEMWVVAYDGHYTGKAERVPFVFLVNGGRADVLLRCTTKSTLVSSTSTERWNTVGAAQHIVFGELLMINIVTGETQSSFDVPPSPSSQEDDLSQVPNVERLVFNFTQCMKGIRNLPANFKNELAINGGLRMDHYCVGNKMYNPLSTPFDLLLDTVYEWVIQSQDGEVHPMHLHTYPMQVVDVVPSTAAAAQLLGKFVDTLPVPPKGQITVRFQPRRFPGVGLFHCHIQQHSDLGMILQVRTSGNGLSREEVTALSIVGIEPRRHSDMKVIKFGALVMSLMIVTFGALLFVIKKGTPVDECGAWVARLRPVKFEMEEIEPQLA